MLATQQKAADRNVICVMDRCWPPYHSCGHHMDANWPTSLSDVGNAIYDAFMLPATYTISLLAERAPELAASMGGDTVWPLVLALLLWALMALVALKIVGIGQNAYRVANAWIRTLGFRLSIALRSRKTTMVRKLGQLLSRRRSASTTPEVDFDDLDLAVLHAAAGLGPGMATSASDLAERFGMRPGRLQNSLDKLKQNAMLDRVIGSTDGFDSYRLSESGTAYVAMWQRQRRVS